MCDLQRKLRIGLRQIRQVLDVGVQPSKRLLLHHLLGPAQGDDVQSEAEALELEKLVQDECLRETREPVHHDRQVDRAPPTPRESEPTACAVLGTFPHGVLRGPCVSLRTSIRGGGVSVIFGMAARPSSGIALPGSRRLYHQDRLRPKNLRAVARGRSGLGQVSNCAPKRSSPQPCRRLGFYRAFTANRTQWGSIGVSLYVNAKKCREGVSVAMSPVPVHGLNS